MARNSFLPLVILLLHYDIGIGIRREGSLGCSDVVYLAVGETGVIPCMCKEYDILSWFHKSDFEDSGSPFISKDGHIQGPGYLSGEFYISGIGSLVINNVTLHHHGTYVVMVVDEAERNSYTRNVSVVVLAPPVPSFPVVNDFIDRQNVSLSVRRNGHLKCSMYGVHPSVNLTWSVINPEDKSKISFLHGETITTQKDDSTYDVFIASRYYVKDYFMKGLQIQCKVDDCIGQYFPSTTKVELEFLLSSNSNVYPVVNGHTNQQHVYLDVNRVGTLQCVKESVRRGETLAWKVEDPILSDKISFKNARNSFVNENYALFISLTSHFEVIDNTINRISVTCISKVQGGKTLPHWTTVDLLLPNVYPVVNGLTSQPQVYLDVDRDGELTCIMKNVSPNSDLVWEVFNQSMTRKITWRSSEKQREVNSKGTVDVKMTSRFKIEDETLERISLLCKVIKTVSSEYYSATKVILIFPTKEDHFNRFKKEFRVQDIFFMVIVAALVALSFCFCILLLFICCGHKEDRFHRFKEKFRVHDIFLTVIFATLVTLGFLCCIVLLMVCFGHTKEDRFYRFKKEFSVHDIFFMVILATLVALGFLCCIVLLIICCGYRGRIKRCRSR